MRRSNTVHAACFSLVAVLSACGGAEPAVDWPAGPGRAAPIVPAFDTATAGPHLYGCWANQTLSLYRPWRREDWRFPSDAPPELTASVTEAPPSGACGPERTTVREVPADVGGARMLRVSPSEMELTGPGLAPFVRHTAGAIADAAVDGDTLLLVGPEGLFRWRSAARPGEPHRLALPPVLSGRTLVRVFRDGPVYWLRDADGVGVPVAISNGVETVRAVGEVGKLPDLDPGLRAPTPECGRVEATIGTEGVRLLDGAGLIVQNLATPAVEALLPLPQERRLVVAAGHELIVFEWPAGAGLGGVRVEARHYMGGKTAKLLDLGARTVAVGEYGVVLLRGGGSQAPAKP